MIQYKLSKKYFILNILNRYIDINSNLLTIDIDYNKLNILFKYSLIFIKIKLILLKKDSSKLESQQLLEKNFTIGFEK